MSGVTLAGRIRAALEGPDPDPHTITERLLGTLSHEELKTLAWVGLHSRVRAAIRSARGELVSEPHPAERRSESKLRRTYGRIEWPPDDELVRMMDRHSWTSAAAELGVSPCTLKRHCREARNLLVGPDVGQAEVESAAMSQLADVIRDATAEAQRLHEEAFESGKALGLAAANTQRVCVRGEWKFLGDCTTDDLEWLANDYGNRAAESVDRSGYYLALAERVAGGGFGTVREMCEAEGSE